MILLSETESLTLTLCLSLGAILILLVALFLIRFFKRKKNKNNAVIDRKVTINDDELNNLIGGQENLISISLNGSRLTLVLKDYDKIKKDELKKIGIDRFLLMSNKIILIGPSVNDVFIRLNNMKKD